MQARIQKWGNSLALRIPKAFADEAGLQADSPVEIKLVNGQIILVPVPAPAYDLEYLLADITDDNLHGEFDTGDPVGNEEW